MVESCGLEPGDPLDLESPEKDSCCDARKVN